MVRVFFGGLRAPRAVLMVKTAERLVANRIRMDWNEAFDQRPRGLLALDLDGTLLRLDGSIPEVDLLALERAQAAGFGIVITTGRFPESALAVAAGLRARMPVICADGAVVVDGATRRRVWRCWALRSCRVIAGLCREHGLKLFEFSHSRLYYDERDADHLVYVARWSDGAERHPGIRGERVLMSLGLGSRQQVELARVASSRVCLNSVADAFELVPDGPWAVKFRHARASKGLTLAALARRLRIPRASVAAVGNGYNDISLFSYVAHSYCMGDAPAAVQAAARHVLQATADEGGGVAEAVERLL
jgi:Cof subfamily protein (haloacid dehalogenase superfamily)